MPDHLRILVVTNLWPEDGGFCGIFVREQVEAVRALGHHVDVEVVAQSRGRSDYLTAAPRVRRRAGSGRYDVVHIHYGLAALAARFTAGVPRVLTLHGSDVDSRWQSLATRLGSGGLADTIYVSRGLAERAGAPHATVISCGVDCSLFTPMERATARARLGIPHDGPVVLFGARPEQPVKRYDIFQAVMRSLRASGIQAEELILATPGQPRVEVPWKFAAADLLLFTSQREGAGMVVKEAAAMGLPVVSTDVGDVAAALEGVTPSAVVPFPQTWPDDGAVERLVTALTEQAAGTLALNTRSNGPERIGWFDNRSVAERVVDVYRAAVAGRR